MWFGKQDGKLYHRLQQSIVALQTQARTVAHH
jgi:hypothetical protein